MKKILSYLSLLLPVLFFSQCNIVEGDYFDFGLKSESDIKIVMIDNDGLYLKSTLADERMGQRKFVVRKFNAQNKLTDLYLQNFPVIDSKAYDDYLGSFASSEKVVFFNTSYYGKAGKLSLHRSVFDKNLNKFTTSIVESFPIESALKSGNTQFAISENDKYASIVYYAPSSRKEPQKITVFVYETNSTEILWKKEISLNDGASIRYIAVSNTGTVIITRDPYKGSSRIVSVSKESTDETQLPEGVFLFQPYLFSKGSEQFLFSLVSSNKFIKENKDAILIYDLSNNKIVSIAKIIEYQNIKENEKIFIRKISYQNQQFQVFTEAKLEAGKVTKVDAFGSPSAFPETIYKYSKGFVFAFDNDGALKNKYQLGYESFANGYDLYRSYGVVGYEGNYVYISDNSYNSMVHLSSENFKPTSFELIKESCTKTGNIQNGNVMIKQNIEYIPKTKDFIFLQILNDKATIVKASGYKLSN